ncbi:MAG: phospholipase D-like domain-containing protein [Cocleimonas sp.]|nr:phospholipase D-like domain-containing protein [Cocleimonas sp.]
MLDASPHSPFPYREGNSIRFLVDGEQFYPTMLKSIQQAQKYILMEMYLFESGEITDKFIDMFVAAVQRGVSVQLLIDAYGGLRLSKKDRRKLVDAGVQLVFYNPLMFKKLKKNLFRTHRKYMIIDGLKAFVGGAGVTDSFYGKNAWRETVVEVKGSVVADWQMLFTKNFNHWSDNTVPELMMGSIAIGDVSARLAYTTGGSRLEIKKVLLKKIENSNESIWLASAYFIPSRKTRKALRKAASNGIDVRLLLPGEITDHPAVRYASRRYYARLLRFGVRIFEYQGRFTHTKMVLIDDWLTIGSSNMDRWNFRWNLEANQEIENENIASKARKIMLDDFSHCHEIKYIDWINRSRIQRTKEWLWGKLDIFLTKYI